MSASLSDFVKLADSLCKPFELGEMLADSLCKPSELGEMVLGKLCIPAISLSSSKVFHQRQCIGICLPGCFVCR